MSLARGLCIERPCAGQRPQHLLPNMAWVQPKQPTNKRLGASTRLQKELHHKFSALPGWPNTIATP
jgi:hypothetical protein